MRQTVGTSLATMNPPCDDSQMGGRDASAHEESDVLVAYPAQLAYLLPEVTHFLLRQIQEGMNHDVTVPPSADNARNKHFERWANNLNDKKTQHNSNHCHHWS